MSDRGQIHHSTAPINASTPTHQLLRTKQKDGEHLTELQQPALPVWVEEGVRQVVPIVLGNFKGLIFNTLIQILEKKKNGLDIQVRSNNSNVIII